MRITYMGLRNEASSIVRSFIFHEGNSHKEKAAFYGLAVSVVLLIFLRAFGFVSFEDPRVADFVDTGLELMKVAAAFLFGSMWKGERVQTKLRDLGHDPVKILAGEAIQARIEQLDEANGGRP